MSNPPASTHLHAVTRDIKTEAFGPAGYSHFVTLRRGDSAMPIEELDNGKVQIMTLDGVCIVPKDALERV